MRVKIVGTSKEYIFLLPLTIVTSTSQLQTTSHTLYGYKAYWGTDQQECTTTPCKHSEGRLAGTRPVSRDHGGVDPVKTIWQ